VSRRLLKCASVAPRGAPLTRSVRLAETTVKETALGTHRSQHQARRQHGLGLKAVLRFKESVTGDRALAVRVWGADEDAITRARSGSGQPGATPQRSNQRRRSARLQSVAVKNDHAGAGYRVPSRSCAAPSQKWGAVSWWPGEQRQWKEQSNNALQQTAGARHLE